MKMNIKLILIYLLLVSCDDSKNTECSIESNGRGKILSVLPLGNISSTFLSDFLIDNNEPEENLSKQIEKCWEWVRSLSAKKRNV